MQHSALKTLGIYSNCTPPFNCKLHPSYPAPSITAPSNTSNPALSYHAPSYPAPPNPPNPAPCWVDVAPLITWVHTAIITLNIQANLTKPLNRLQIGHMAQTSQSQLRAIITRHKPANHGTVLQSRDTNQPITAPHDREHSLRRRSLVVWSSGIMTLCSLEPDPGILYIVILVY